MTHGKALFTDFDSEFEDCFIQCRIETKRGEILVTRESREPSQLAAQLVLESRSRALQANVLFGWLGKEKRAQSHRPNMLQLGRLRLLLLNIDWNPDVHSSINRSAARWSCCSRKRASRAGKLPCHSRRVSSR